VAIGKRIKILREQLGLSQEELAVIVNISRSALANYENNLREPKGEILVRIARSLKTTTDYLLGRTNDPFLTNKNKKVGSPEQKIKNALSSDPKLLEFWQELSKREDLKVLFKQTKDMSPESIKRIIKYIKMVEDEEASEDF